MTELQSPKLEDKDPWDAEEVLARYGSDEIITTGSLLYPGSEKLTLYPFKEDRTYGIVIDIQLSKEPIETISKIQIDKNIGITVSVLRYFGFGTSSLHFGTIVAVSEKYKYSLSIAVNIIGQIEDFWLNVQYNIVRQPLP